MLICFASTTLLSIPVTTYSVPLPAYNHPFTPCSQALLQPTTPHRQPPLLPCTKIQPHHNYQSSTPYETKNHNVYHPPLATSPLLSKEKSGLGERGKKEEARHHPFKQQNKILLLSSRLWWLELARAKGFNARASSVSGHQRLYGVSRMVISGKIVW